MILHVSKPYQYSNKASLTPPHLEPPPCLQGGGYNTGKYMGNSNSIKAHIVPFAGIRQKSGGTRYLCEACYLNDEKSKETLSNLSLATIMFTDIKNICKNECPNINFKEIILIAPNDTVEDIVRLDGIPF